MWIFETPKRQRAFVSLFLVVGVVLLLWAATLQKDLDQANAQEAKSLAQSIGACTTALSQNSQYQAWTWDAIQGRCASRALYAAQGNIQGRLRLLDTGP